MFVRVCDCVCVCVFVVTFCQARLLKELQKANFWDDGCPIFTHILHGLEKGTAPLCAILRTQILMRLPSAPHVHHAQPTFAGRSELKQRLQTSDSGNAVGRASYSSKAAGGPQIGQASLGKYIQD